jgi:hypothetical protein
VQRKKYSSHAAGGKIIIARYPAIAGEAVQQTP